MTNKVATTASECKVRNGCTILSERDHFARWDICTLNAVGARSSGGVYVWRDRIFVDIGDWARRLVLLLGFVLVFVALGGIIIVIAIANVDDAGLI